MNAYSIWYFDKNVPDYKYIIPLCIQYACLIVIRLEGYRKMVYLKQFNMILACNQDAA